MRIVEAQYSDGLSIRVYDNEIQRVSTVEPCPTDPNCVHLTFANKVQWCIARSQTIESV